MDITTIESELIGGPQLNGAHFRITVAADQVGFVNVADTPTGVAIDGYFIDVLEALSRPERANFTYELKTPSGHGSLCGSSGATSKDAQNTNSSTRPYSGMYYHNYPCGQSDVTDVPLSDRSTDFYTGLFYVTSERLRQNQVTIPLYPPITGTLAMVGTATRIRSIGEYVAQQNKGRRGPVCVVKDTVYPEFLRETFPTIQMEAIGPSYDEFDGALKDKTCDVIVVDHPIATSYVVLRSQLDECTIHGQVRWDLTVDVSLPLPPFSHVDYSSRLV